MKKNKKHIGLNMVLDSETATVGKVISAVENMCGIFDYNERMVKLILPLVLDELMRNAIKHGNKNDKSKPVIVTIDLKEDKIRLAVEDRGGGFDYGSYVEKKVVVARDAGSGRGVMMVINYASKITFKKRGSRIEVELDAVN